MMKNIFNICTSTYQQQGEQWSLYLNLEQSICRFPHLRVSLWRVSATGLPVSVHRWILMFFLCRMGFDQSDCLRRTASDGQIWAAGQASTTQPSRQQHPKQVSHGTAEWCHHQPTPRVAEVDQSAENVLRKKHLFFRICTPNLPSKNPETTTLFSCFD